MNLTDDEYTVLSIAVEGQSMMAIGRWASPIEHLVAQGMLKRHDTFNNVITPKGRQALHAHEEKLDLGLIEAANKVANAKAQADFAVDQAVKHLVIAARATNAATGQSTREAAHNWAQIILQRALEASNE